MKMNFKGLVDLHTLPKTTPLLPLYEAIINSIQSIEDAQISNGKIEIIVEREKQMNLFNQWETDIENIIIVDNCSTIHKILCRMFACSIAKLC